MPIVPGWGAMGAISLFGASICGMMGRGLALVGWLVVLAHGMGPERCNGVDDDGDGRIDEGPVAWAADRDGDGSGDPASLTLTVDCGGAPAATVVDLGDCDDGRDWVGPGAVESCNGVDDDCDGSVDEGSPCGCQWFEGQGSAWQGCSSFVTWDEAAGDCAEMGYHLASIEDNDAMSLLHAELGPNNEDVWIGLNDRSTEGVYAWSDGTSVGYTYWGDAEPTGGGDVDCVELDRQIGGRWNDKGCDDENAFLCEIECVAVAWFIDNDGDGLGAGDPIWACVAPAGGWPTRWTATTATASGRRWWPSIATGMGRRGPWRWAVSARSVGWRTATIPIQSGSRRRTVIWRPRSRGRIRGIRF